MFLGGLGKDHDGEVLENIVKESGALTSFAVTPDLPTGHCIALVDGDERTLCANLGAANRYKSTDLWSKQNIEILKKVKVIYVEGFFLNHSFEATMELAEFAKMNEKIFVFNLCGEYVCKDIKYVENVLKLLPFVNFIFGNQSEFLVFLTTVETGIETYPDIIRNLNSAISSKQEVFKTEDEEKTMDDKNLLAIVTDGCNPVTCVSMGDSLHTISVDVPKLDHELIKVQGLHYLTKKYY